MGILWMGITATITYNKHKDEVSFLGVVFQGWVRRLLTFRSLQPEKQDQIHPVNISCHQLDVSAFLQFWHQPKWLPIVDDFLDVPALGSVFIQPLCEVAVLATDADADSIDMLSSKFNAMRLLSIDISEVENKGHAKLWQEKQTSREHEWVTRVGQGQWDIKEQQGKGWTYEKQL